MSKCLAIVAEDGLEPTAQTNSTLTAIKLALLQKQANQSFAPNDKIYIIESGEWEAPVTGWYKLTLIGGGDGGMVWRMPTQQTIFQARGGAGGEIRTVLKYLTKGQTISVTIGAGGFAYVDNDANNIGTYKGGNTLFGDIIAYGGVNHQPILYPTYQGWGMSVSCAGGAGFDNVSAFSDQSVNSNGSNWHLAAYDAVTYGGGGGCYIFYIGFTSIANATENALMWGIGNGKQGCIIAEFFNPEKVALPIINNTDLIPYVELIQRLEAIEAQLNMNS